MSEAARERVKATPDSPWASFWQFNPDGDEDDGPEVEAMDALLTVERNDDERVLISVRGKVKGRYEKVDSVWLELTDEHALKLIVKLAAALASRFILSGGGTLSRLAGAAGFREEER